MDQFSYYISFRRKQKVSIFTGYEMYQVSQNTESTQNVSISLLYRFSQKTESINFHRIRDINFHSIKNLHRMAYYISFRRKQKVSIFTGYGMYQFSEDKESTQNGSICLLYRFSQKKENINLHRIRNVSIFTG